ncbi:T9SS type A sorting domain-containing protein [Mangrovimonas sp. YM274]|uniref:T9SS type A sorting domain-containing protein n=1 Tax=Mangrovimonas sp. YM274 TaxID=3070660 RepID=UPI0027DCC5D7|nr:T9SS type A sorting domain-containing protein [Mangrovimonas sp. YM274]WMI67531.1 T9SS type A sorting domain-containing protein [Mangrovimonas sp. YM274]
MNVKLPNLFLGTFLGASLMLNAQEYEPLIVDSGFTADIVANGATTAMASTTDDVDGVDWCFMSTDFNPTGTANFDFALPADGLFNSEATPDISFQLADFASNNSLRLVSQGNSGTLTFTNDVQASKLFVVGTTGSGSGQFTTIITFTDASIQIFNGSLMPDWYSSNEQPIALSDFGRVNRSDDEIETDPTNGNPRLYQVQLDILPENYGKTIESIEIEKTTSSPGIINIMAISAELAPSCLPVTNLEASATANTAEISWDSPTTAPANGLDYYLTTDSTAPDETTEPTANLAATETSVSLADLTTGTTYYFWIRTNCGVDDLGAWELISFTPGQVSATYTEGDLPTEYDTPSASSVSSCPGLLTISVPEGYQIANVDVSYSMTANDAGWISDQASLLACNTTGQAESSLSGGSGFGGTYNYSRTGLDIADGATGDVEFALHAWKTYTTGDDGCTTVDNKVDNNTWTITVTYEATLSNPNYELEQLSVYPNPANNLVTVKAGEQITDITILNLLGQVVLNHKGNSLSEEVNISNLAQGNYILKTSTATGKQATTKLIKQ